ncbi:MAG: hypothetical protein IJ176_08880 [Prevotella sp.]|nr:hypothetical protein [Prevotella sp.]
MMTVFVALILLFVFSSCSFSQTNEMPAGQEMAKAEEVADTLLEEMQMTISPRTKKFPVNDREGLVFVTYVNRTDTWCQHDHNEIFIWSEGKWIPLQTKKKYSTPLRVSVASGVDPHQKEIWCFSFETYKYIYKVGRYKAVSYFRAYDDHRWVTASAEFEVVK